MKLKIDFEALFKNFFELSDWKDRTFKLAGLGLVVMVLTFIIIGISMLFFFIPIVGFIFFLLAIPAVVLLYFGYIAYMGGYEIDLILAMRNGKPVTSVVPLDKYKQRIGRGLRVLAASALYLAPAYAITTGFSFFTSILSAGAGEMSEEFGGLIGVITLMFIPIYILVIIYELLVSFLLIPVITAEYSRTLSFKSMLNFSRIFAFIRNNVKDVLWVALVLYLFSLIVGIVIGFSFLTIFLCIGIIVMPIVVGIGYVYLIHVRADVLSKLSHLLDEQS